MSIGIWWHSTCYFTPRIFMAKPAFSRIRRIFFPFLETSAVLPPTMLYQCIANPQELQPFLVQTECICGKSWDSVSIPGTVTSRCTGHLSRCKQTVACTLVLYKWRRMHWHYQLWYTTWLPLTLVPTGAPACPCDFIQATVVYCQSPFFFPNILM